MIVDFAVLRRNSRRAVSVQSKADTNFVFYEFYFTRRAKQGHYAILDIQKRQRTIAVGDARNPY
jgi:hypothetical protein